MSVKLSARPGPQLKKLAALVSLALPVMAYAQDAAERKITLPEVKVVAGAQDEVPSEKTGAYTVKKAKGATGLNLSLRQTPQSVSVVTRSQMDDFNLTSVNDVFDATTGVIAERVETDRTYYTARGFDVTNFQADGIGIPFVYGLVYGDMDTAIYDRVEIIRGANGLMSGTGNPSATINYVRKRPTAEFQASGGVTVGSWNNQRVTADVAGPLNEAKTLRGRFVVADQSKDSYLDRYGHDKTTFHGILEADLGESTLLTLGHTQQNSVAKSPMWGALPLFYNNGQPTDYDRSTSTAADWGSLIHKTKVSFVELTHQLANDWEIKGVFTHTKADTNSKLFYVYGDPDPVTGAGLFAYPSRYDMHNKQDVADVRASGPFSLGGRQHEMVIGANWSESKLNDLSHYGAGIGTPLPPLEGWADNFPFPEPAFNAGTAGSNFKDTRRSMYAGVRFNLADDLKLIVGANGTTLNTAGTGYGVSRQRSENELTPYLGVVYDINKQYSAYGSYTEIFNPQHEVDSSLRTLDPVRGKNYEAGVKAELFGGKLNSSFAVFRTEQNNLANQTGTVGILAVFEGINATSTGFEFDVGGQITPRWQASAGYTNLSIDGQNGEAVRTYTPRQVFRLSTTYRVPMVEKLKVGASVNWRSETSNRTTTSLAVPVTIKQPDYAVLNLMARYDITDKVYVAANINNVTDEKYLTSVYWTQGFYAAPRNMTVSLNWKY